MHGFRSIFLLIFVFVSYASAQSQMATNISIADDQANWAELWRIMSARQSAAHSRRRTGYVSDSTRPAALFDTILRVNAQARHKPRPRSGEAEFLFQGDVAMKKRDVVAMFRSGGRRKRAVMKKLATKLWQRNNIAYLISSDLGTLANQSILEAIKQWENTLPCMGKWKDISKLNSTKRPRDYIHFTKEDGCYSDVGRQGGRQVISIGDGCDDTGIVLHEIGHAMGFWHEQSRTDRDNYVEIHWNNILPTMKYNFEKYSSSKINDLGVSYDYESLMHYGPKAFSKDDRAITISIKPDKNKNGSVTLGERYQLSDKDKKQARLLYNCANSCSPLPRLSNGRKYGRNLTHSSVVLFYCNWGYQRVGLRRVQCNDGKWSGEMPRCRAICYRIASITDGWVSGNGFLEGDELSFGCKENYVLEGAKVIKCIGYRRWNASKPRCGAAAVPCPKPSAPANGRIITQLGSENMEVVSFECDPGYHLEGSDYMSCLDGLWNETYPKCLAPCSPLPRLTNGRKYGRNLTHSSVVLFYCNWGYQRVGLGRVQCNDGKWSGEIPRCRAICYRITSITKGWVSGNGYLEGDELSFGCEKNHILEGAKVIKCIGYRRWNSSKPRCRAATVPCPRLSAPANGRIITQLGSENMEAVSFECDLGYKLEGGDYLTCLYGLWNDTYPKCSEKCLDPSRNTNGRVIGNEFYHGKEVQFFCPRNFVLVPSSSKKLICRNGKWGGTIPSCKAPCSRLPSLSNGRKYGRSLTHGSIVRFYCNRGYQRVGSQLVQCNDGRWSANTPRCLEICYKIRSIKDGWVNGDGYLEGEELSFRCKQNYVLEGAKVIKCIGYWRWNASKPTCKAPCTKLRAPANGRITQQGFQHKEIVRFACNRYYHLEGKDYLTCRDGRWNDRSPKCLAPCKRFSAEPFRFGYLKKDGFRHDEEVIFDCRDPFVIDGLDTLRCNNGAWSSKKLPICGGPCSRLDPPRNGVYLKNGYRHREKVKFGCKSGFQMVGTPDRVCHFGLWNDLNLPRCEKKCSNPSRDTNAVVVGRQFYNGVEVRFICRKDKVLIPELSWKLMCVDGKWNGKIPSCKASCPALSRISHGYITGKRDLKHGSVVQFECNAGYQRIGASSARCNDGRWSGRIPRCLAICKKISSIKNGQVNGRDRLEGYRVSFKCNKNYILEGRSVIRCTDTGKWNFPEPKCKASCPVLSEVPNGYITSKRDPKHGSVVQFACNAGYHQIGASSARCNDGKWSERIPLCLAVILPTTNPTRLRTTQSQESCQKLGPPQNGFILMKSGNQHKDVVLFGCDRNYKLKGNNFLQCNDGAWNSSPPICERI